MIERWNWHTARALPGRRAALLALVGAGFVISGSLAAQELQEPARQLDLTGAVLAGGAALALAWSPRVPVLSAAAVVSLVGGYLALGYPFGPALLCLVVAVYSLARRTPLRTSAVVGALGGFVVALAALPRFGSNDHLVSGVAVAVWTTSWLLVPWLLGVLLRTRGAAARLRQERLVADAVSAERMRMARDVHDAAGHGFSVIALQADVALLSLDERPAQARASLEAIRTTSRTALGELRATLGAFAPPASGAAWPSGTFPPATVVGDDPVWPDIASTDAGGTPPDLTARLDDLEAGLRSAGLAVVLDIDPRLSRTSSSPVHPAVEEALYRVVQESLTNVVQHAGRARVRVTVRLDGDEVRLTVTDRGEPVTASSRTTTVAADARAGHGITGMRERLRLLGGTLDAEPGPAGGFVVTATVPALPETVPSRLRSRR